MRGINAASVAIIGIACRFPGAADHRTFWKNLCNGVESITFLSDEEVVSAGVPAELVRDPAYVKASPLLPGIDLFDAAFFEYSPKEATLMDPQQRILLEVAWEAFEDAGYRPGDSDSAVGVFVGSGGVVTSYLLDRLRLSGELPGDTGSLAHIGNDKDFASTRISYKLNLTGPSLNVQTACSTSLVAVHLACQAILAGECDMALAGAATVRVPHRVGYLSVKGGILSPDGHCRAFDADAQGTIFGSGVGAVLLKDLTAAVADGDNIYAVIRGSAINNDGADKVSYTASSVAGQAKAMVEAMTLAEVSADDVGYVECHGTGTAVGDPLEIDALSRAFRTGTDRRAFCAIGSVKTNIGHLEQTAGIAAIIKAALALKHGKIPPSLNFSNPNPKIDFDASPFFVNTLCREWPATDGRRLAAVNSLGLGGTNAFAVLGEPPKGSAHDPSEEHSAHLFTFSAKSEAALHASIASYGLWLEQTPDVALADQSFTLTSGRMHFPCRFAAVAGTSRELQSALARALAPASPAGPSVENAKRRLAFLFSGQGSQYPGMAADLYRRQPVFREVVDRCADVLRDRLKQPLLSVLFGESDSSLIDQTAYTQPVVFAVQAGLVELWRTWGIVPDVVLGHSVGEFAAAYCAGVYTLEDALLLIAERARLMQALPESGLMASIFADEADVRTVIDRETSEALAIAAVNAPENTVVAGTRAAVENVVGAFRDRGTGCQLLTVSHAFHSPLMQSAIDGFHPVAAALPARAPTLAWISSASAKQMIEPPDARYWCDQAMGAVRFADALKVVADMDVTDFVEIGPGNTLLALGRRCLHGEGQGWLASLGKRQDDCRTLLCSLGELYRRGYDIDWDSFNRPNPRRRVSLPTYRFDHQRFWLDGDEQSRVRSEQSGARGASLTGVRLRSALPDVQFEAVYSLDRFRYLDDHRIYGMAVLPIVAGLTALRDAAAQHFATDAVAIANLQYREAMVLPQDGDRVVQSILTPVDEATAEFRLMSAGADTADPWRTHMIGMVRKGATDADDASAPMLLDRLKQRCPQTIPIDKYYATARALGLEYGPSFRGIEMLTRGNGEVLTRVRLPQHVTDQNSSGLHPALLDACLHAYPALVDAYGDFEKPPKELRRTYLPIGIERFSVIGPPAREVWMHAVRRSSAVNDDTVTIDMAIYRDDGSQAAAIVGLSLKPLPPEALSPDAPAAKADWLYRLRWDEHPALSPPHGDAQDGPSGWLILADRGGRGEALAGLLAKRGDTCRLIAVDDSFFPAARESEHSAGDAARAFAAAIGPFIDQSAVPLRGIVDLWPLDVATDAATVAQLEAAQRVIVGSALALFQAVNEARERLDAAPRIWLVTRNAVSVSSDDPAAEVATAALWGFGRSAALEHPQLWGGLVDLGATAEVPVSGEVAALLHEIVAGDGEDQVCLRSGRRFVARLVRATVPAPEHNADLGGAGSYLITGGLGALGIEVANWLVARRGARHLVLASRRGRKDPRAEDIRQVLTALGAEVTIVKADVTVEGDVRRMLSRIARSGPPLKGVFHCAGMLDDGILIQMDWQKLDRVMAPKVAGAWLLHEHTQDFDLDHFVLFSSILSLIGSAGQANYAAGNAFIDALAARRRQQGLPALVLNWGPWAESGLATASGEKGRTIWRSRGTEYISAETGWQALDALVGSTLSDAAITITQWPVFIEQFASVPRLYSELQREATTAVRAARPGPDAAGLKSRLLRASKVERRALLVEFVQAQAMRTLGVAEPIDARRPLRELGLDSLMSVTLVNRLEAALGMRISAAKLIRGPSIDELVDDIFPDLAAKEPEAIRDSGTMAPEAAAGAWLVVVAPRPAPRFRLFCFPFAGGGSAVFRNWAQSVDPAIEVVAVEPPGRLSRIKETPVADVEEFVDRLLPEMRDMLDRPFAFFGHCLGGLTMYETARRLIHSTDHRPYHLFASGARPPDRLADQGEFEERLTHDLLRLAQFRIDLPPYAQPDDVFGELIRHFNIGATEQLLEDPELRLLMLPVIRAEFQMVNRYEFTHEPPWEIPITCFAARGDPYVSRRHALGWGRFTNSRLQVHMRPGGHFAVVDDAAFINEMINRDLLGLGTGVP